MAINIYTPRTMMGAVRQMMPVNTFLKTTFFGGVAKTFVTEVIDIDYYKGRRKMAPFVSPRLAGKVMERDGFQTQTYKPPLIKPLRPITSEDLKQRGAGENLYATKSPDERALELLAEDMIYLDDSITRREEWMCSQVMFHGKVHMIGEGVDQMLDYGFTNKVTLLGAEKWDSSESDPIEDLEDWRLDIIQKSGITPDTVVMSTDVVRTFVKHPKVKEVMDNLRIKLGQIEPRQLPNGVTYIGSITSLGLDIYSYNEWYLDDETDPANPVEVPMVPAGTVCMASTRVQASIHYGAVTLMDTKSEQFSTYEGERIPDSWVEKNPAQRWLQMNSRPLPVPQNVESWLVAKVQ
ncbi:major capsid protein [Tumebacillus permanentifrigoris]|uniref:Major capsid protein E n=1 Tax=Tumebacillus permanentifrigoris TaxID=378543 RepID=A0A316DEQ3_9BACL|nr:major capsid protein [Tumebacillus permanentifrigoris]PWK16068.1 major capsid protein E [Tumebacillus permanentifrigoris]